MTNFGEILHHENLPFIVRVLIDFLFIYKLDRNDSVLAEMVAFVDNTELALAQSLGLVDVEIVIDLLHSFHLSFLIKILLIPIYYHRIYTTNLSTAL